MERKEIESRVIRVITETLSVKGETVELDKRLIDDLGADSLDLTALSMELESQFGVELSDEESLKILTVSDAVDIIQNKLKNNLADRKSVV